MLYNSGKNGEKSLRASKVMPNEKLLNFFHPRFEFASFFPFISGESHFMIFLFWLSPFI
jgi:hypothetical protein